MNKAMSDFCLEGITRQGNQRKKGFEKTRHCQILTKTCTVSKTIVDKKVERKIAKTCIFCHLKPNGINVGK